MKQTSTHSNRVPRPAKILVITVLLMFVYAQFSDTVDTFTLALYGTNYHAHIDALGVKDTNVGGRPGMCADDYYRATIVEDHSSVTFVNCVGPGVGENVAVVANSNKSLVRLGTVGQYRLKAMYTLIVDAALVVITALLYTGWLNKKKNTP